MMLFLNTPNRHIQFVTCFFNPIGYQRLTDNFKRFREHFPAPLISIELGFDGKFYTDSEIKISGGIENIMWQKERLLNIAIEQIHPEVKYIGWVDADLIFHNKHFLEEAEELLEDNFVVQLGRGIEYLDSIGHPFSYRPSAARNDIEKKRGKSWPGGAWLVRSEVARLKLIDYLIVGGGDTSLFNAWIAKTNKWVLRQMNLEWKRACEKKAVPHTKMVKGKVGCTTGLITHLYHGNHEDRYWDSRFSILTDHQFNPNTEIKLNQDKIWEWNTDNDIMKADVSKYFIRRNEDKDCVKNKNTTIKKIIAITCHFNPCGYTKNIKNYYRFRKELEKTGIELRTAELVFDDADFEIADADIKIRGNSRNLVWQKERLLNMLIDTIQLEDADAIAWLDADILFLRPDWLRLAHRALETYNVIQLFETAHNMDHKGTLEGPKISVASIYKKGEEGEDGITKSHPGFAWAMRTSCIKKVKLLETHLTGGGDSLMIGGFTGTDVLRNKRGNKYYNIEWKKSNAKWDMKAVAEIQGSFSYIKGSIIHLFHGTDVNRKYFERRTYLADHDYDPEVDIEIDENGLLTWTDSAIQLKPKMVEVVKNYFSARNEDN